MASPFLSMLLTVTSIRSNGARPYGYILKAGNGIRTHNPLLGRQALWPLSYSRKMNEHVFDFEFFVALPLSYVGDIGPDGGIRTHDLRLDMDNQSLSVHSGRPHRI